MILVNADGVYKAFDDSYRSARMPKKVYLKFKRWLKKNEIKSEPNIGCWEWFEEWSFNGEVNECVTAGYRCSICKKEPSDKIYFDDIYYPPNWKYCPNCGASLII